MGDSSALIGLNQDLLCKTTGWHNNCGLNCLTHFLYSKLENNAENNAFQKLFEHNPEYQELLRTFQAYYHLPSLPTWTDLYKILSDLENPADREALFSPVLRRHLGKVMARDMKGIWDAEGAAALSEYLHTGAVNDVATPIFLANRIFFEQMKKKYDDQLKSLDPLKFTESERTDAIEKITINNSNNTAQKTPITEENIAKQIIFVKKNIIEDALQKEAVHYWLNKGGCQKYVDYISDLNNSTMISADHISLLCSKLHIDTEIYTPDSISHAKANPELAVYTRGAQNSFYVENYAKNKEQSMGILKLHNTGLHWEYEEPNKRLKQKDKHNFFYPMSFFDNDSKLGKFKTYGNTSNNAIQMIHDYVKTYYLTNLKNSGNNNTNSKSKENKENEALSTKTNDYFPAKKTSSQTLYNKLHHDAQIAMDILLNKLENGLNKNLLDFTQKQMIFEFYFNAIEEEFKQAAQHSTHPNERKIKTIIKEIQHGDISGLKDNAIEVGLTHYDRKINRSKL